MTNREYIQSIMSRFGASNVELDIVFAENSDLSADEPVNVPSCKIALYNSLSSLLPFYESRSEGDFTVKWNWEAIKAYISSLAKELGKDNPYAELNPTATFIDPFI